MTAHQDHRQLVVVHALPAGAVGGPGPLGAERVELGGQHALTTEPIERAMACDLEQPSLRVVGHAAVRPRLERTQQRVLHDLLGEVEPVGAEPAGQHGHHPAGAVAEQMRDESADGAAVVRRHGIVQLRGPISSICRTSSEPASRCGESLTILSISS